MWLPILRRKSQSPPKKWKALSVKPSLNCPSVLCKVLSDGTQIFSFQNLLADEAKQVEQVATKKAHALEESSEGLKGWGLDFELFCFFSADKESQKSLRRCVADHLRCSCLYLFSSFGCSRFCIHCDILWCYSKLKDGLLASCITLGQRKCRFLATSVGHRAHRADAEFSQHAHCHVLLGVFALHCGWGRGSTCHRVSSCLATTQSRSTCLHAPWRRSTNPRGKNWKKLKKVWKSDSKDKFWSKID